MGHRRLMERLFAVFFFCGFLWVARSLIPWSPTPPPSHNTPPQEFTIRRIFKKRKSISNYFQFNIRWSVKIRFFLTVCSYPRSLSLWNFVIDNVCVFEIKGQYTPFSTMGIKFKKLLHYLNKAILKIITVEFVVIVLSLGLFLLSACWMQDSQRGGDNRQIITPVLSESSVSKH